MERGYRRIVRCYPNNNSILMAQNFVACSLHILDKTQTGYLRFPDFWSILYEPKLWKNYSRISHGIVMKLGRVTKLDRRNISKTFGDSAMSTNCDVIVFFGIYGQFATIGSQIPDAWSKKLTFSLTTIF